MLTNGFNVRSQGQSLSIYFGLLILTAGTAIAAGPKAAPIPPAPEFTSPDIKPTFADFATAHPIALWKKILLTDPLLKPPFAAAPADSLKGMAAGIRAVQLDVPNRIKAAMYLGTVDCVTYPQAQDMLIATMLEDPSEEVRYEAVMALRNMLSRGCCNMDTACECDSCCNRKKIVRETANHAKKGEKALIKEAKGGAKKLARKVYRDRESEEQRYDCCRGCANEKVMKALAKVAFEKDDQCCWLEPSERVRTAAAEAMCLFRNYADGYSLPEPPLEVVAPPNVDTHEEVEPSDEMESGPAKDSDSEVPAREKAKTDSEVKNSKANVGVPQVVRNQIVRPQTERITPAPIQKPLPAVATAPVLKSVPEPIDVPIVQGLRGRCIVALKSRQILPVSPEFSSVFEDRTYYFSSAEAKSAFDQNPTYYAPAYGGIDPVTYLSQRRMEPGQFLREFEGQFYFFTSKENWETFKQNPNRYVLRRSASNVQTVSANGTESQSKGNVR